MKKLLLTGVALMFVASIFAQNEYAGTPWGGTAWKFGADSALNFHLGENLIMKKSVANGVPHYVYDIGEVDTLKLPSEDLTGTLVAGSGDLEADTEPPTDNDHRMDEAKEAGITLFVSDTMAMRSNAYGGSFSSHKNRGTANGTSGWYRYTCNFDEGNYKFVIRGWGADKSGHGFWIRFYEKTTMTPLYPWTRVHPGSGAGDDTKIENAVFVDITKKFYSDNINNTKATDAQWIESTDEFSLSGDVVFEYSNIGPSADYPKDVTGSGAAFWGEFTFMQQGADGVTEDKYAPVVNPYEESYDELETISVSMSEDGTLYLVPAGTKPEDFATAALDSKVMTADTDTYEKLCSELVPDTVQLATVDAAGNTRLTAPIVISKSLSTEDVAGSIGDTITLSITRTGFVALVDATVAPDLTSIQAAIDAGTAEQRFYNAGTRNFIISNLNADLACKLYLVDTATNIVCTPSDYQLSARADFVAVNGVSLDETSLDLIIGAVDTIVATITPAEAEIQTVTWSSSDETIATVNNEGIINAIAVGDATITVTTNNGFQTATCDVSVKQIAVTGVSVDPVAVSLEIGETATLTATVAPEDAGDPSISWESSDVTIASVADGVVTAEATGTATITVTTTDGDHKATCTVTVASEVVSVTGVNLDNETLSVTVGGTATLVATIAPQEATEQTLTWKSSNDAIATVTDGTVRGESNGVAIITVKTVDGEFTDECVVTVGPNSASDDHSKVFSMYPNPVNGGSLFIQLSENSKLQNIEIYNALGARVLHRNVEKSLIEVNTANLTKGVYFVKLKGDKQNFVDRFVVQ